VNARNASYYVAQRFLFPGEEKETNIIGFKVQACKEITFISSLLRQNIDIDIDIDITSPLRCPRKCL
jgi:hypothetical protein